MIIGLSSGLVDHVFSFSELVIPVLAAGVPTETSRVNEQNVNKPALLFVPDQTGAAQTAACPGLFRTC